MPPHVSERIASAGRINGVHSCRLPGLAPGPFRDGTASRGTGPAAPLISPERGPSTTINTGAYELISKCRVTTGPFPSDGSRSASFLRVKYGGRVFESAGWRYVGGRGRVNSTRSVGISGTGVLGGNGREWVIDNVVARLLFVGSGISRRKYACRSLWKMIRSYGSPDTSVV